MHIARSVLMLIIIMCAHSAPADRWISAQVYRLSRIAFRTITVVATSIVSRVFFVQFSYSDCSARRMINLYLLLRRVQATEQRKWAELNWTEMPVPWLCTVRAMQLNWTEISVQFSSFMSLCYCVGHCLVTLLSDTNVVISCLILQIACSVIICYLRVHAFVCLCAQCLWYLLIIYSRCCVAVSVNKVAVVCWVLTSGKVFSM